MGIKRDDNVNSDDGKNEERNEDISDGGGDQNFVKGIV